MNGMDSFKSFREMIQAFEQPYMSVPGGSTVISFNHRIRVEGHEDGIVKNMDSYPTARLRME